MAASWAEEVQDYQHDRRVKVHPDLFKGRTVGYVRGENSKRERSYNPLLGRFLDQHREREQQDFEEKVKKNYLNMARDIQLRKEAPYDLITHERKFEALVPEALDPAKPKDLKCPVPDTGVDYNIISNLRFDAHHWAHPQKRPIPKDRVPKARMVPALLHKDFNILTNRYLEHHEEKVERDRELNLLEAAEKMRQQPFNPLSQKFCDARLEERMRAYQDALTTEVKLRNEEAQRLSYRGNITNCYDMLSHQVKDPELMDYIKQSEGGRKVRYKTRFRFEEDVRHADVKQEDRVKRMKPLQIAHERFTTEMERGYDILTNQDFGHRKEKHEKFLHTPRTKPLLTPWQKVLEQTGWWQRILCSSTSGAGGKDIMKKLGTKVASGVSVTMQRPQERTITVERAARLGMNLNYRKGTLAKPWISTIEDGTCLIHQWNQSNPSHSVTVNDRVISVNGSALSAVDTVEKLRTATGTLTIKFVHFE